jgi:tetratricopeptide (TPR) repeat protein
MNTSRRLKVLFRNISLNKITIAGLITAALIAIFCCVTAFYYITTPSNAIIITVADFPPGLSTNFTPNNLNDHVKARLNEIIELADSSNVAEMTRLEEAVGSRPVKQPLIPIRASSNAPSPVFKLKWKGVDLNLCRTLGMSIRAKRFLELGVIGVPQGGWRLTAFLKDRPHFSPIPAGSAPQVEGACSDFEKCANDLTEQILKELDNRRLLNFYIKMNTVEANRRILELYQTISVEEPLKADDLVAWGNAFSSLRQFPQALEKYQEALDKDPNSCPAHVGSGYVYYSRPHGTGDESLRDLEIAEEHFRKGISCDARNVFARTSLCHALLQKWNRSKNSDARLIIEAKEQCEKALEINPQFVRAEVNLGYVLYRQGKHEEALRHFDRLSQRYPADSILFLNYGFLLYLEYLKDPKEETLRRATAQTRQSWDLNQNSYIAANNLGYFYYEQNDNEKAVEFWNKANALIANPDSMAGLALGAYKRGDLKTAVTLLDQAVNIDSSYRNPTYLKERYYWSDKALSDLAELLRKANAR